MDCKYNREIMVGTENDNDQNIYFKLCSIYPNCFCMARCHKLLYQSLDLPYFSSPSMISKARRGYNCSSTFAISMCIGVLL